MTFMYFFFPLFCFLSCLFFVWTNKRTDIDSNVQILNWSLSCWDPLTSTKKEATSTFNPSINQLSFSGPFWTFVKVAITALSQIGGIWALGALLPCSLHVCWLCVSWQKDLTLIHIPSLGSRPRCFRPGSILLFLLLCFVVMADTFIFSCTNWKINYNSMQKNYSQAQMWLNCADSKRANSYCWSLGTR